MHGGINNDAVHNETETCNFTSNVEGDLNVHEETTHEEIHSNDHLRWRQNDYYYFYGFMQIVTRIATKHTLSCCGKVYKNRVAPAIYSRKTHGKCSYLGSAVTALQFNECEIIYPVKTKLKRHMATRHHGNLFENVVAKNLEAQIKVKALTEVIASNKVKKVNIKIPMDKNGKGYNHCRKTSRD